ncbi:MAG TPA: hypothetical protein VJ761_23700 [Ktedonobacteraceae bacterium]|nr:hypothetical protein [Ktedonobacteraceae bacterium]
MSWYARLPISWRRCLCNGWDDRLGVSYDCYAVFAFQDCANGDNLRIGQPIIEGDASGGSSSW